ncbi:WapI family immunity protein [Winogradskyella psychrotolerans]|uniref:WapI family immunity protein n=1 Tax=Winogradskyella psychrotolerans TaxID=1344585 RepID=UPI0026D7DD10
MILNGVNQQTVDFRITNYQFPEIKDCHYDSNWLLVYLKVKSNCKNWQTVGSSLLVGDLNEIIKWFDKLSNNIETDSDSLGFLELNLKFKLSKKSTEEKHIRIMFNLESRLKMKMMKKNIL